MVYVISMIELLRHKNIKPNKILRQSAQLPQRDARVLWAGFGVAFPFRTSVNSRIFSPSRYSARYAAPENAKTDQAAMDAKVKGFDDMQRKQDTEDEHDDSATAESLSEDMKRPRIPVNGRSTDLSPYGYVSIEILSVLVNPKKSQSETPSLVFCKHITNLQDCAEDTGETTPETS